MEDQVIDQLQFSDIVVNPLLQTTALDGILTYFPQSQNSGELSQYIPLRNVNADKIKMDIDKAQRGGMTPGVAMGSESPIYGAHGRGEIEFEAAEFREKVTLFEKELYDLRELGTLNQLTGARQLLARKYRDIEVRLANRLEWMRKQMLFDGTVSYDIAGTGLTESITYVHPAYLEPTASNLWSNTGTADPLDDLQLWAEQYMLYTGFALSEIVLPLGTLRLLSATDKFQNLASNNFDTFKGTQQNILDVMIQFAGISNIRQSSGFIHMATELTAASANGDTTLDLRHVEGLEAGDVIVVKSADMESETLTVSSVSGKVVTVSSGVVKTAGYAAGDPVVWRKRLVPEDQILMVGELMSPLTDEGSSGTPDADKLSQFAEMLSTYSRYVNLEPRPGMFTKLIDKLGGDPPSIEQVLGIRCGIALWYPEAWMTATIK